MKKYFFRYWFVLMMIFQLVPFCLFAQEAKSPVSPDFEFKYFKDTDNNRILQTRTSYFDGLKEHNLSGLTINLYTKDKESVKLGEVISDLKGIARLILPAELKLPVDKDGNWYFKSEFTGDSTVEGASQEILIQDINLEMTLSEADSIKVVQLKASKNMGKELVPISGETIILTVPRMFSQLPVGEGFLDENGLAEIEFPTDIPGDNNGNITIVAKFEDHPTFGNVEKRQQIAWGIPGIHPSGQVQRELWTQIAPKWMILSLSVMLVGVWGHYIFAIVSLIRIKNAGKE